MSQQRQRGIRATPNGKRLLREAKGSFEDGRLTNSKIAEKLNLSEKTVGRFFNGESVDKETAYPIISFFGLSEKDVLSSEELLVEESIEKIESEDIENSTRAKELIGKLEIALNELKQSEEINIQAMDWLKANRKTLAKEASEAVFKKYSDNESSGINTDESDLEQFSQDITKYLHLLYLCLEEGSWELIDKAIQDSLVPVSREITFYTDALIFIKDQQVTQKLAPEVAQAIAIILDYLIKILPIRF